LSAVLLLLVTEPRIDKAIAIEEAGEAGHSHGAEAAAHDHGEIVTRLQQQIGGVVTVILVGVLLGLAFAVVYARTRHRLPGVSETARSVSLAGLGFVAFALVPALLMPANPPAVGDPDNVDQRTLSYLLVIVLTILLIAAAFAVDTWLAERATAPDRRWLAAVAVVGVGVLVMFTLVPRVVTEIPGQVPASLIWEFRLSSLGQLAGLWMAMGLGNGVLLDRSLAAKGAGLAVTGPRPATTT